MSADSSIDVTGIRDEDVLKKMWQDTEDFGRKKEIRAHMYKLREARLRDFYNNGEVSTEIQRTTKTTQNTNSKSNRMTTHADNLADHSFLSLKSKEIRDSESPTRDVSYKISEKQNVDQGWTVTSGTQRSEDGKTHTSTHLATTSGTQIIDGGKIDFDARAQQNSSVYQDGDDKNFVRAVGDSSSSVIHQEAVGGDESSSFKATTTKSSSSSKHVSESKSSTGDLQPRQALLPSSNVEQINNTSSSNVSTRVFTTDAPKDVKSHPNYIEGNTKVTQETKTLPDGTVVTTTKYETRKGNSVQTSTHKKYSSAASSSSEQKISSSSSTQVHSSSSQSIKDSKNSTSTSSNNQRAIGYVCEPGKNVDVNIEVVRGNMDQIHQDTTSALSKSEQISKSKLTEKSNYNQNVENRSTSNVVTDKWVDQKHQKIIDITPVNEEYRTTSTTKTITYSDAPRDVTDNVNNYSTSSTSTTTVSNQNQDIRENRKAVSDQFITSERQHEKDTRDIITSRQKLRSPDRRPVHPRQETTHTETTERYVTESSQNVNEQRPTTDKFYSEKIPQQPYEKPEKQPQETYQAQTKPKAAPEPYEQPDRRQPIKPGKSELDQKTQPTEGQYDTTYRTDFTNKKISVEVSAAHDAFARSLRAVTPERITRPSSTPKSRSPNRSSVSPEKNKYPSRSGSPRKSEKFSSSETITYSSSPDRRSPTKSPERNTDTYNRRRTDTDTVTTTSRTNNYNTDTITRKHKIVNGTEENKRTYKTKQRSPSPSGTTTSDFEYIRNVSDVVTDLDEDINITRTQNREVYSKDTRPTSLEIITTKKTRKVTERSPTSPLTEIVSVRKSPTKDVPKKSSLKSPTKDVVSPQSPKTTKVPPEDRPFKRTDTYEERVKQILGITNVTSERRRSSLERNSLRRSSFTKDSTRSPSSPKLFSPSKDKPRSDDVPAPTRKSPERRSPTKDFSQFERSPDRSPVTPKISQIKKSPEKQQTYPERKSPSKEGSRISEFPSQIRRSPEKEALPNYPEKRNYTKEGPKIAEFPSQIRKSPEKRPLEKYPEKKSPVKERPTVSEFPSQVRKSPERSTVSLSEIPSQTRRLPEKSAETKDTRKTISISQLTQTSRKSPERETQPINEFPSQIRKTPERESLEPYPEKKSPGKKAPSVNEFPSQTRKSPEREPLEPYPERKSPERINEFPSQIRKSPEHEPLEPYPERKSPERKAPSVNEFPSQIRKSPEPKPLEPYPEKKSPEKKVPSVNQFPSQIRKSPGREPLEPVEKKTPSVNGLPSQIRKPSDIEPLESYLERKSPESKASSINEFPSQIRKSPEREPLEPYPERKFPEKKAPSVNEFPSQIRKSPEREQLEPYPEKKSPEKKAPSINEFPSQIRQSPEREPLESYPERKSREKKAPLVNEFPSQIRKTTQREPLKTYPEKGIPEKKGPSVCDFPSQDKKSPERETFRPYQGIPSPKKTSKKPKKLQDTSRESEESSSSDEEIESEETVTQTIYTDLKNKVPVNEPLVTKKFIDQLCREEEIQRTDITKKSSEEILEEEILRSEDVIKPKTTVKKDRPDKGTKKVVDMKFIEKEKEHFRTTTTTKKETSKEDTPIKKKGEKAPAKKPVIETTTTTTKTTRKDAPKSVPKPQIPKQPSTYRTEKSKFIGETEYKTAYSNVTTTRKDTPITIKPQKPVQRNTLWNVENLDKVKTDTSAHIRTHRIDDSVVKRTQMPVRPKVNGEVPKSRPKESMLEPPTKKREPISKAPESKLKYTTTIKKTITAETKQRPAKTPEPISPRKHVVTATITVSPKSKTPTRPVGKAVSPSITTTRTKKVTQVKTELTKQPKLQNGHISSDTEDESVVDSIEDLTSTTTTEKRRQITRTTSDQVLKHPHKAPVRGFSKPELGSPVQPDESSSKTPRRPEKKCITTKTVIINNKDTEAREIIVDLQRSKSSREPTPDRLCPHPVTSDEEGDAPRYPDQISEPDDGSLRRRPKKLHDIPIIEGEDTEHFTRITEIEDTKRITEVDRVEEMDESLLSVNKKISKFLDTADKLTKEPLKPRAPKVGRPTLIVTEDLKSDDCLLSVSDKVSKFINTAEQLVTPQPVPERPKSPKCKNYSESTEFTTGKPEEPTPKVERPDFTQVDKTVREDESSLSVSDKVSKFITAAEKLTTTSSKTVSLSKIDIKPKSERQPSPRPGQEEQPKKAPSKAPTECVQIETEEQEFTRRPSPERGSPNRRSPSPKTGDRTPTRRPSNQYTSVVKTETTETKYSRRDSSPKLTDTTPKSTRRSSQEDSKTVLSTTSRLRSTESIKKAKALFENITKEQETVRQRDILSRPSVFVARKQPKPEADVVDTTTKIKTTSDNLKSTRLVMDKIRPKSKSPDKSPQRSRSSSPKRYEITRFRSTSPEPVPKIFTTKPVDRAPSPDHQIYEGDVPHYMLPLDRSLRPKSPHRENIDQAKPSLPKAPEPENTRPTKFGVTLRRTDSGKAGTTFTEVTTERRKSSITLEKRITEEEIEEIFDLDVLEELLEKVVGYELRRKIRTQIRLVKKLISENTLEIYIAKRKTIPREAITRRGSSPFKTTKPSETTPTDSKKETEYQSKYVRKTSPQRTVVDNKLFQHTDIVNKSSDIHKTSEYQSSYSTHTERRTSSDYSKTTRKSSSPNREKSPSKTVIRTSPDRKTTRTIEASPTSKTTTVKTTETVPGGLRTTTTKTTESKSFTTLKKTKPVSKTVIVDDQPEWVKRKNLRKTIETTIPTNKRVMSSSTTSSTTKKTSVRSSSPLKETKPTDIITSCYGVGPTDENGTPLFGLRALRAQNRSEQTTKVQGTMISSEFYSENGEEPVGHVSVTKYSNDPKELEQDGKHNKNQGITSVTTTQKFGYKDTPSLRSLTDNKKEICDTSETSETKTKTTKLNRRGSVKAISQKFIENTVESLKNERQTSYPKAGLILRTSSFRDSSGSGSDDNRETSPAERESKSTVTVLTSSSRVSGGETFLTNKSRVSGVQDVITRMKAEDYQEGDNEDDIAARGLLNKFIGSQVILSGLESHHGTTQTISSSPSSTLRRTTKITTVTEGAKPTTSTRIFQRPATEEDLATVWDEQTLRLLLEQSTDYEERRIIRARLRQVMAEQEEKTETTKEITTKGDAMTTKVTTKVTTQQVAKAKPLSPFAKFRQLDKQNSLNKSTPPRTSN